MPGLGGTSQQRELSDTRRAGQPCHDLTARSEQLEREMDRLLAMTDERGVTNSTALTSFMKASRITPTKPA